MKRLTIFLAPGMAAVLLLLAAWLLVASRDSGEVTEAIDVVISDANPSTSAQTGEEGKSAEPEHAGSEAVSNEIPPSKEKSEGAEGERLSEADDFDEAAWLAIANELAHKDPRILMAKAMLGAGEYEDALAMLEEIIAAEPGTDVTALAHLMKGIALWGKGDGEAALAEFETIILEYPESAAALEAVQRFGQYHFAEDTILDGMDWVMDILEADPTNMAAKKAKWDLVARAARRGRISDLEALWEICMDGLKGGAEPIEGYQAGLALAKSLARFNRPKMFELFKEIAEHSPDPTTAGEAKLELVERYAVRQPDDAIRLGEEVLASLADELIKKQTRRNLVHAYLAEGDVYMAQQTFDQVMLDGWPEGDLCYFLTAFVGTAVLRGADNEALSSWLDHLSGKEGRVGEEALTWKALLMDPSNPEALEAASYSMLLRLGDAYLSKRNFDLAGQVAVYSLQHAENDHPGDLNKHLTAANLVSRAMYGQGNYAGAAEVLRTAMDQYPDAIETAEWVVPLAHYLKMTGRYEEAIAEYKRVVEEFPDSIAVPRVLLVMGHTYQTELRDPVKAREAYQCLIDTFPESHHVDFAETQLESLSPAQ